MSRISYFLFGYFFKKISIKYLRELSEKISPVDWTDKEINDYINEGIRENQRIANAIFKRITN